MTRVAAWLMTMTLAAACSSGAVRRQSAVVPPAGDELGAAQFHQTHDPQFQVAGHFRAGPMSTPPSYGMNGLQVFATAEHYIVVQTLDTCARGYPPTVNFQAGVESPDSWLWLPLPERTVEFRNQFVDCGQPAKDVP